VTSGKVRSRRTSPTVIKASPGKETNSTLAVMEQTHGRARYRFEPPDRG
jgi:hypothetical protein